MGSRGFSLIELLVSMGIAAIAMAIVVTMFTTLTRSYTTQNASADVQQVGRAALDYMVQNIRMAGFNPLRIGNVGIKAASSTRIEYNLDRNQSGDIDLFDEEHMAASSTRIEYNLDRNQSGDIDLFDEEHMAFSYDPIDQEISEGLYLTDPDKKSWYPLVGNVTNLTFTYRDRAGKDLGPTPVPDQIKIVDVLLTVAQQVPRNEQPVSRTYSARIICRNLVLQ
jgi:type IV pilus assembly protein PilW